VRNPTTTASGERCEKCEMPEDRWSTCTHPGCPQDQEYLETQADTEERYGDSSEHDPS